MSKLMKVWVWVLVVAGGLGTGCGGLAKTVKALDGDEAIVVVEIGQGVYTPRMKLTRVGGSTNAVEVKADGTVVVNGK